MSADEPQGPSPADDPYSRAAYRRMIAWERRIEREGPLLMRLLDEGPDRSVLDLGCGTGEHVAFLARAGARAVGLDRSESMIEAARDHESRGEGRFVLGDALAADDVLADEAPFGLALCLGNMLPHVLEDDELARFVTAVRDRLAPGGRLLLQILNYERIVSGDVRALPVNVRAGEDDEEIVFVRLMRPLEGGRILFFPTTLTLDADSEEPVAVRTTRRVELRAWTAGDLTACFEDHGFEVQLHGDMQGGPYEADASHDLVVIVRRI
ncbi:MAG: class I SAM-dependent methyltransferase [Planctomycetota bacterium]|nr:class I SAM-dependent methyltransferase [Planctomycetota bacterium]